MARIGLALAALSTAAVLTACSGSDFAEGEADEIVAEAKSAMGELEAVKVSGAVDNQGQQIEIDLQASTDGDCTGTIGIDDGTAELLGVGGETWMRPDEAFWTAFAGENAPEVLSAVGDKWVVIPAEDDSFNTFCDVDSLLDELLKDADDGSTYTNQGPEEVEGEDVVAIDNEDADGGSSTGYVLVDEPHYLLKVERTAGESTGSVTFSEFDEEFEVEAPAEDDVVDLSTLGS